MGWGVHDYPSPPERDMPVCPECGEECETYYRDGTGRIIGCENCIDKLDAYFYKEEMEETERNE